MSKALRKLTIEVISPDSDLIADTAMRMADILRGCPSHMYYEITVHPMEMQEEDGNNNNQN